MKLSGMCFAAWTKSASAVNNIRSLAMQICAISASIDKVHGIKMLVDLCPCAGTGEPSQKLEVDHARCRHIPHAHLTG